MSCGPDKHSIHVADAVGVFEDDYALTVDDEHPHEDRFITIGRDFLSRVLVVVYTWRGNRIRTISARKAVRQERDFYKG
ncbi:MAG: BrnT family toxin [Chloroflexi bacterium]|nr:BrnT family toxin [Chloroflexota bacterium]